MNSSIHNALKKFSSSVDQFYRGEITAFELSEVCTDIYFFSGLSKEIQQEVPEIAWLLDSATSLTSKLYISKVDAKDPLFKSLKLFWQSPEQYKAWWQGSFGEELKKRNVFK